MGRNLIKNIKSYGEKRISLAETLKKGSYTSWNGNSFEKNKSSIFYRDVFAAALIQTGILNPTEKNRIALRHLVTPPYGDFSPLQNLIQEYTSIRCKELRGPATFAAKFRITELPEDIEYAYLFGIDTSYIVSEERSKANYKIAKEFLSERLDQSKKDWESSKKNPWDRNFVI